jgi:hypothetical protein
MLALAWERGWHAGAGVPRQRDYQAGIPINPADGGRVRHTRSLPRGGADRLPTECVVQFGDRRFGCVGG